MDRITPVPREYAKCKNHVGNCGPQTHLCVTGIRYDHRAGASWTPAMPNDLPDPPRKPLSPAAQRALAEAEARRAAAAQAPAQPAPKEFQGPKGPEPTRYGDWENKGIA